MATDSLIFWNPSQLGIQVLTALTTALFSFVGTYLLLKVIDRVLGLRVSADAERMGLDLSQHNERAYS